FNYVIINTHHDASDYSNGMNKDYAKNTTGLTWQVLDTPYRLFAADASMSSEEVSNMYARTEELWGLIATAFKEYDYRLIFEGFNEILGMSRQNWDNPKTSEPIIQSNELNNAFIRGVRNAGGAYNPTRVLSCQHYGGQAYLSGKVVKGFDVTDSAGSGYIILQIHYYMNTPSAHKAAARDNMEKYPDYPLIFGEIGWNRNSNSHLSGKADGQLKNGDGAIVANSLYDFCEETVRLVAEQGAKVFWWDNARWSDSSGQEILGLLNRSNATWYREGAADGLVAGANALSNNSGTSGNNSGSSGSSGSGSSTGANTSTEQENITLSSPANVAATAGSGSVTVTWGSVSGASRYKLERSSDNGSSWTTLLLYQTDTGYTDSTVTAGTTYKYRVTAYSSTGGASNGVVSSSVTAQAAPTVVIGGNAITSPETAAQVVSNITVGWNLGNTLDCTTDPIQLRTSDANKVFGAGVRSIGSENEGAAYETSWGDAPVTTQEMLEAVVAAGFNAIRIPVTWGHHLRDAALPYDWGLDVIDRGDYSTLITEYPNLSGTVVISPFFLKRVKEVVNMALNAGFEYVILNTHHETADYNSASSRPLTYAKNVTGLPWLTDIPYQLFHTSNKLGWRLESVEGMTAEKDFENMCDYMHTLWTLIAKEFKDYDYRLIFEGFNEMLNWSRAWDQTYHAGNGNEATTTQLQRLNAFNNTFIKAVRNAGGEYNRKRVLSCETFGAVTTDFILEPFSLSNVPESFRSSGYCLTDSEISSENSRIILQAHYYNNVAGNFQSAAQRVVAKGLPAIFGEVGWHTDSSAPSDLYNFGKNLVQQAKSEGVKVFWWDNHYPQLSESNHRLDFLL
ncbi:MAG: cellulase family glycosylhydrolase, partial [Acutalibacteraceae bacterium]|nr:cellulase family glycosylhydrolase [Acutalibacteraceae bacterium]